MKERVVAPKGPIVKDSAEVWVAQFRVHTAKDEPNVIEVPEKPGLNTPIFYEVMNNKVMAIDAKKDVRQLKLASYNMDKDFSKRGDLTFQENCQNRAYGLSGGSQVIKVEALSDSKDDFPNVAFNRAYSDHDAYTQLGARSK